MAQNVYGPGVRMGNWNEDVYLEEERMRHFLEKREKGELLIQRNRRVKKNILRPMQLSVSEDGYVHYGDKVIIVNPDQVLGEEAGKFMRGDLSLCMSPDEVKAQLSDDLEIPCGVSAVQTIAPMGRNTFTILSDGANSCEMGQVVVYGQNFCLGIAAGLEGKMLYLTSDHRTLLKSSLKSGLQEVTLTDEVTHLNCWQAAFLDPQLRLEYEGFPVRANEKIVIYHRHTNRALAVHRNLFLRTYFGKEMEVVAHTYLDSHKVEKPKNQWMLVTGNPRNKSNTMLDISKPITEDTRALEQAMGINT
ncbi:cilia- and flagella-associated protein 161 isoform X1 [Mus musculus]|uniref:Cilia- and flagella-associated protein 161 n=3 Tax=Mus musculus TaxID=10090 RepID=CF161_MOUSE|nr:cilia- and flagella-associated protein 161 [Mus musculus]XP_006508354.1 cilia- and flagella-associated protein 161 isoform X1 [Mus musculus]Q6P8Y0.1 RecName: Full=Cilia- and flagella-associated protein 161 [Mus musculus]8I7R_K Chain K, Cilia- and flagella-associated protein 161 [Mus musculus]8I7R_L Chain L, Cilia- and flagella-associated protein 161 [Mus musculus]8IYJ_E Chain E, Cilia- and flagella-associated protein 161 [Mus musculus]8IYJ_F Chain F, Cilia- and flagella-associated protein |eukprot:NP_083611.2 cilia- and flagella-associated protein 161 [Mus musculus]